MTPRLRVKDTECGVTPGELAKLNERGPRRGLQHTPAFKGYTQKKNHLRTVSKGEIVISDATKRSSWDEQ